MLELEVSQGCENTQFLQEGPKTGTVSNTQARFLNIPLPVVYPNQEENLANSPLHHAHISIFHHLQTAPSIFSVQK